MVSRNRQRRISFGGSDGPAPTGDPGLRVAGLFAGIGGVERGLARAGHEAALLCEVDDAAAAVLAARFPNCALSRDIRALERLPDVDLISAGFPCQDLSQAGRTQGIQGARSGLVSEVFRLLDDAAPLWLMLENVPFMLSLDKGRAMDYLASELERRGYDWAYRVVDTRAFGLPQRRRRVILLASRQRDPRHVLLTDDASPNEPKTIDGHACGFYWTEGTRGLGWAIDAVPTLKGGSGLGIPSPPAIVLPDGQIVTPDIRDAERLQGFPANWTRPAEEVAKRNARWRLVGNAVSVPVSAWVGQRLTSPRPYDDSFDAPLDDGQRWPTAAWSMGGSRHRAPVSEWPRRRKRRHLADFLGHEVKPLSERATSGFRNRTRNSRLRFPEGFIARIDAHLGRMRSMRTSRSP